MKLLLDTHIWLWSLLQPKKLTSRVATALRAPENELWLSPISTWELLILVEKGRVILDTGVEAWISKVLKQVPAKEAPLTHEVAVETRRLKLPHRDPADRFLAATAKVFDLTLVTADARLIEAEGLPVLANR